MGTVCVAVVIADREQIEIPAFVLSCRVFGYGVETAMLREIDRLRSAEGVKIVGRYRATNQNHLCKSMYTDHGFLSVGDAFVSGAGSPSKPNWLEIISNVQRSGFRH